MASPFEILESFVKVGERGLTAVLTQLGTLRTTLLAITRPTYTVIFSSAGLSTGQIQQFVLALQQIPNALAAINNARVSARLPAILSQLAGSARTTATDVRDLNLELRRLVRLLALVRPTQINLGLGTGRLGSQNNALRQQLQLLTALQTSISGLRNASAIGGFGLAGGLGGAVIQIQNLFASFSQVRQLTAFAATTNNAKLAAQAAAQAATLYAAAIIGVTAAAAAAAAVVVALTTKIAAQREVLLIQVSALTGNAAASKAIFSDLQAFAIQTGISFDNLINTAKRLTAFGFATEDVADLARRLGIAARATGSDLDRFVFALAQIREAGALTGEELRQLRNSGLPIVSALAATLGVQISEIAGLTEARKISFDDVVTALESLTDANSKFGQAAAATSRTAIGEFGRLRESSLALASEFGVPNFFALVARNATQAQEAIRGTIVELKSGAVAVREFSAAFSQGGFFGGPRPQLQPRTRTDAENWLQTLSEDQKKAAAELTESLLSPIEKYEAALARIQALQFAREGGIDQLTAARASVEATRQLARDLEEIARNDPANIALKKRLEQLEEIERKEEAIASKQRSLLSGLFPSESFKNQLAEIFEVFPEGTAGLARGLEGMRRKLQEAILDAQKLRKTLEPSEALLRGTQRGFDVLVETRDDKQLDLQTRTLRAEEQSKVLLGEAVKQLGIIAQRPTQLQQIPGIFLPAAEIAGL